MIIPIKKEDKQFFKIINLSKNQAIDPVNYIQIGSTISDELMDFAHMNHIVMNSLENLLSGDWNGDGIVISGNKAPGASAFKSGGELCKTCSSNLCPTCKNQTENENLYEQVRNTNIASIMVPEAFKKYRFFFNHNRMEVIDMVHFKETLNNPNQIHPLAILLAVNNGAGKTDYIGQGAQYAGRWGECGISASNKCENENYNELTFQL